MTRDIATPAAGDFPSSENEPNPPAAEARERLVVMYDQARNGTAITDPNEWEADDLEFILSDHTRQADEIERLSAEVERLREALTLVSTTLYPQGLRRAATLTRDADLAYAIEGFAHNEECMADVVAAVLADIKGGTA